AILLIAFLPTLKILRDPLVGLVALGVMLLALFGRVRMPFGLPGAFAAAAAGTAIFWLRAWLDAGPRAALMIGTPRLAVPWPTLAWLDALPATLPYLAVALPFALVTIIGGIDNTESAAAAGDEYRARDILFTEAAATIVTGLCGGVIQNTPYIGHPAYKAMGARAGHPLATGLLAGVGASPASLTGEAALAHQTLRVLGNGFILTALLWGWTLVAIIERRLGVAGALCAFASLVTLFGVIHSPLADGALFWPWAASAALPQRLAGAYGAVAAICWLAAWGAPRPPERISARSEEHTSELQS